MTGGDFERGLLRKLQEETSAQSLCLAVDDEKGRRIVASLHAGRAARNAILCGRVPGGWQEIDDAYGGRRLYLYVRGMDQTARGVVRAVANFLNYWRSRTFAPRRSS